MAADRNRSAFVLTISDRVSAGRAVDESGPELAKRLEQEGFVVERGLVPDDRDQISSNIESAAQDHALVIATGGTGLAPRDVTPQALRDILDYEVPGFGELMRSEGRRSTPLASLSRSLAGVVDRALVIALPGSTRGAIESLEAAIPLLDHALQTLVGERGGHARESVAPGVESAPAVESAGQAPKST